MWSRLCSALLVSVASLSVGCDFFSLDDSEESTGGTGNGATGGATGMGGTSALGGTGGTSALGGSGGSAQGGASGSAMGGTGTEAGKGGMAGSMAGTSTSGGMAGSSGAAVAGMAGDMALGGMGAAGSGAGMAGSASGAGGSGPVTCASLNSDAEAHGGHCYLLVTSTVTWTNAKNACAALGAHLVTVSSASPLTQTEFDAENNFVYSELGGSKDTWIGLSDGKMDKDSATDAAFTWVNDEPLTLSNWADNEPNHYMKDCMDGSDCWEHCVFMMTDPAGKWNDELCETPKQYICEWDEGG